MTFEFAKVVRISGSPEWSNKRLPLFCFYRSSSQVRRKEVMAPTENKEREAFSRPRKKKERFMSLVTEAFA